MIGKNELKNKLLERKSKKQIAKELFVSEPTLRKYIRTFKLECYYSFSNSKKQQLANKSVDIDFFKSIDTEEKAYIFGLILSDGFISNTCLGFTLQEKDKDVLQKIKITMNSKHKISYKTYTDRQNQNSLLISSKEIVDDLKTLGVKNNKSFDAHIPFSKIPSELLRHVVRGIFDGDGSFSQNRPCIATSSLALKDCIIEWSENNYNYTPSITVQNNNYRIYFRKPGFKVICDMYENSNIYMDRKYNTFLSYREFRIKNQ